MENSTNIKGRDYALDAIRKVATSTPSLSARKAMARAALTVGNYDEAGLAEWRSYQAEGCPSR